MYEYISRLNFQRLESMNHTTVLHSYELNSNELLILASFAKLFQYHQDNCSDYFE